MSASSPFPPPVSQPVTGPGDDAPETLPGQMTFGWRVLLFAVWMLVIFGLSSVWQVSVQVGHHTVWLGPEGEPQPLPIQLLPFLGPTVVLLGVIANQRWVTVLGTIVALLTIGLGVVDLGYYQRLGVIEIAIGVLALVGTLASLSGRVQRRSAQSAT